MATVTLKSIKDCDAIFMNGQNVLVCGKKLWIFHTDGTYVAQINSIRNPNKVVFLPDCTALVDVIGDGTYHYISLNDGISLWSTVKKGRRNSMSARRFAVSPDGLIVYDICHGTSGEIYIDRIIPRKQIHEHYSIRADFRVTRDIWCNKKGILCILQSCIAIDPEDPYTDNSSPIQQNCILEISIDNGDLNLSQVRQWQSQPSPFTTERGCDGRRILRNDFSILDLDTMKTCDLLVQSDLDTLPQDGFGWEYDSTRNILTIYYLTEQMNIIIDCNKRKVVGRYPREDHSIGYQGCLIGDEFWTGTRNGIARLPFPPVDMN